MNKRPKRHLNSGVSSANGVHSKQVIVASAKYSGPIPPSTEMARYNDIIPNGADRIMTMAEKAQDGEREKIKLEYDLHSKIVRNGFIEDMMAKASFLAIMLAMLGAGVYFFANGEKLVAVVAFSSPVFYVLRYVIRPR